MSKRACFSVVTAILTLVCLVNSVSRADATTTAALATTTMVAPTTTTVAPTTTTTTTAPSTVNVPGDYATIQAAVDAVAVGGTVNVAAGTYVEQVTIAKAVSVLGAGPTAIIDGTAVPTSADGLVRIDGVLSGTVTLDGFTLRNAPLVSGFRFAVMVEGCDTGASLIISHNTLEGTGYSLDYDYGLYAYENKSSLLVSSNDFSGFGDNQLVTEVQTGAAEIRYNTMAVDLGWGSPAIFSMSYNSGGENNDVTAKQWFHHNTIEANGGYAISMVSAFGEVVYNERTNGKYTDVEISDNDITDVDGSGIQLEVDGDNGGFVDPVITGNTIAASATTGGSSRGIRLLGDVTGALIANNDISGFDQGIAQVDTFDEPIYATGTLIFTNQITGGVKGVDIAGGTATLTGNSIAGNSTIGVDNQSGSSISAEANWWGADDGPGSVGPGSGDGVSVDVDYSPWLGATPGTSPMTWGTDDSIQDGLDASADGDTVRVATGTYTGNFNLDDGKATFLAAGASPGQVTINGDLTLGAEDTLLIDLDGTTAGTGYDQWVINGAVALNGATMTPTLGYAPTGGDSFIIIDNDGADAVTGTFAGLAEGASFSLGGKTLVITYVGGTGNDVVITVQPDPTTTTVAPTTTTVAPTTTTVAVTTTTTTTSPYIDGVPKAWLAAHNCPILDPWNTDTDGDGEPDGAEWAASTNPDDINSYLKIWIGRTGGPALSQRNYIVWIADAIDTNLPPYLIEKSTDLATGWAPAVPPSAPRVNGYNTWLESTPASMTTPEFFRVVAPTNAP